jgi:hypothetical protein
VILRIVRVGRPIARQAERPAGQPRHRWVPGWFRFLLHLMLLPIGLLFVYFQYKIERAYGRFARSSRT